MSFKVSDRLEALPASATLAINSRARALRESGVDVISFAAGEPDFNTPAHVRAAAAAAAEAGDTKYTPAAGTSALKAAIIGDVEGTTGVRYSPTEVAASCGAKHSLYNLFQALLNPGDRVIIPAPYWVSYPAHVTLAGGEPVVAPTRAEDGFLLTPAGLEAAGPAKALILNSPCNPTGAAYDRGELAALVQAALAAGMIIVSDEIYARLTYDSFKHTSVVELGEEAKSRCFLIGGVSKSYAMTGWRIGWVCGDSTVLGAMMRLQSQSTSNPSSISQAGAVAALEGSHDFLGDWRSEFDRRRRAMVGALDAMPGVRCALPRGAFYAFPDVSGLLGRRTPEGVTLTTDTELALWLLDEARIASVPGTPFGAPGHLRFSYAVSLERVQDGLGRLGEALGRLQA
jgi:aspartate aminotransferase